MKRPNPVRHHPASRRFATLLFLSAVAIGCETPTDDVMDASSLGAPTVVDFDVVQSVATTAAATPSGSEVFAWVTSRPDGSPGRLSVVGADGRVVEVEDPEAHPIVSGESSPQFGWGPSGDQYLVYVATSDPQNAWSQTGLRLIRSEDGGGTWSTPASVGGGDALAGYRFGHAFHVTSDGTLFASWLDDRPAAAENRITAVVTRSTDGGRSWTDVSPVDVSPTCECCRVGLASTDGAIFMVWRKLLEGGVRDIVISRSTDGGESWDEPTTVRDDGWVFDRCPDAGPDIAVDAADRVHVAWWSGREGDAGVRYARSDDGGRTFDTYRPVSIAELSRPAHVRLEVEGSRVAIVWDDGTLAEPRVALVSSEDGGDTFGSVTHLSESGAVATRPDLALSSGGMTVVWSERSEGSTQPRVVKRTTRPAVGMDEG